MQNNTNTTDRIALISDIHGNLPAFEAVLKEIDRQNIKAIWNMGDMVGYYPFPSEVIQKLQDIDAVSIIGNYDLKVLDFERKKKKWQKTKRPEKYFSFRWTYEHLSVSDKKYLRSLPEQQRMTFGNKRILLVHGSPESVDEHVYPETPKEHLQHLAEVAKADIIISGHTHQPMHRKAAGTCFINPGSVGRPEGDDPRACYAMLTFSGSTFEVKQFRVEYDLKTLRDSIRALKMPEEFITMLEKGKNLDKVMADKKKKNNPSDLGSISKSVQSLVEKYDTDKAHSQQVTKLALMLFDELIDLHGCEHADRDILRNAGLLHDIGWSMGQKAHHKNAMRMIIKEESLDIPKKDKIITGLVARYHRKALPGVDHPYYADLSKTEKKKVDILASILRIADGLDRSHMDFVRSIRCSVDRDSVILYCRTNHTIEFETEAALRKSDLFEQIFRKPIIVKIDK